MKIYTTAAELDLVARHVERCSIRIFTSPLFYGPMTEMVGAEVPTDFYKSAWLGINEANTLVWEKVTVDEREACRVEIRLRDSW